MLPLVSLRPHEGQVVGGAARWAWLPFPVLVITAFALWLAGYDQPHENRWLLFGLHFLCTGLVGLRLAGTIGRTFLATGHAGFLLLACGMLVWGGTGLTASTLVWGGPNPRISAANLGIWMAALALLCGVGLFARPWRPLPRPGRWLLGAASATLVLFALLILAVLAGQTPSFYTPAHGWSLARELVVASLGTTLAVIGLAMLRLHQTSGSPFAYWFGMAMLLMGAGKLAVLIEPIPGSLVSWTGRLAQAFCALYLLFASRFDNANQGYSTGSLGAILHDPSLQYPAAILAVAAATCVRLVLLQAMGNQNVYITFFPAVMASALFGGVGPGLLATLLSGILANRFWGQGWSEPAQWLGLLIFFAGCGMICLIAEALHRARAAAARAEAQARAAAELEASAEALSRTVAELTRSNRDLEQFAYVASHDLQEPLRMVRTFVGLLRDRYRGRLDPKADQYIDFAVAGATRMQTLIHDLLAYSRVSSGPREVRWVNLEEPLDRALADLDGAIRDSGAVITHDPLPSVPGDPAQLAALFQNLLGNAIKFHSGRPPAIHVAASAQEGRRVLHVSDNGIGLDPAARDRIFDIFQRLHGRDSYPGNGIGLAICKKIVERHGGSIWVESRAGEGATFHVSLPGGPA